MKNKGLGFTLGLIIGITISFSILVIASIMSGCHTDDELVANECAEYNRTTGQLQFIIKGKEKLELKEK